MRFDTRQQFKLGQQMKLAPRVIQSMELLQMPLLELEERIEQELSSNAVLELVEREAPVRADGMQDSHASDGAEDFSRLAAFEESNPDAAANEYTADSLTDGKDRFDSGTIDRRRLRASGEADAKSEAMANAPARSASLHDQLLDQWRLCEVDDTLRPPGELIIMALDEDGYLRIGLDEVVRTAPPSVGQPDEATMERALTAVQLFLEPAGIAARNARECLLLQLDSADLDEGWDSDEDRHSTIAVARVLVADHLEDLMNNRLPRIAERSGHSLDEIKAGLNMLRRLSLSPARRLVNDPVEAIIPDAIVEYDEELDRYIAYLNDARLPNLRINREYALMSKDRAVPKPDRDFLKTNLSNAQWLMDAVEQRRGTLLRVVRAVVDAQREAFDHGIEALKPLPMTLVAEQLGVHVATVSRAVADKHLLTPHGVLPLRGFFTGGLSTESGEEVSANAVKAVLRELVDNEDKSKPLSDEALAKALKDKGFEIARRTVAKYRGQLDIPGARMRKQF
ncbi:MAG: RNA polymerase factor sigma-54 [Salinibacterium sp.]|nr:RNA polymerase factor sigma-54 [Salinibacterium sp.]